jgi:hypothetical protein
MAPKLEQVFKLRAFLSKEDMLPLGSIQGGPHRYVVPVVSGFIEGTDFKADLTSGGSDWLLLDTATGTAQLDIRANARTKDGECICKSSGSCLLRTSTFLHPSRNLLNSRGQRLYISTAAFVFLISYAMMANLMVPFLADTWYHGQWIIFSVDTVKSATKLRAGILKMDPEVQKFLQWSPEAKTTKSSDHYFMTTPRYEVSSERLKWMEQEIFIGQ